MIVSDTGGGGSFKQLDPGSYPAVCTQIVGIGPQESNFGLKEKIKLRFEVPSERVEWEVDGEQMEGPIITWATYTASLNEKANLRMALEGWRGRAFSDEELKGFEMDAILGAPCMLSIIHRESNGKTYANIASISKLMNGVTPPKAEGELISFDIRSYSPGQYTALPEWLQKRVDEGLTHITVESENPAPPPDDGWTDDDIPF